jgi:tetratricopeptide (TPR) repeat protein
MKFGLCSLAVFLLALPALAQVGGPGGFDKATVGRKADLSVEGYSAAVKMGRARLKMSVARLNQMAPGEMPEQRYQAHVAIGMEAWEVAELCNQALHSEVLAKELEEAGMRANAVPGMKLKNWQEEFRKCVPELRKIAIDSLKQGLSEANDIDGIDEVVFQLGYFQSMSGDADSGAQTMKGLLEDYPQSTYVPEAWLMIAEYLFDKQEVSNALAAYREVDKHKTARVRPYAKYKSAWCLYNLQEFEKAYKALVVTLDMCGPGSPWNHLYREVMRDVAMFYASWEDGIPEDAVHEFLKLDKENAQSMAQHLAAVYSQQGKFDDALNVLEALAGAFPDSEKVLDYRRLQVETVYQSGDADSVIAAAEMLAKAFEERRKSFPPHAKKAAPAIAEMFEGFIADYRIQANKGSPEALKMAKKLEAIRDGVLGE